MDVSFIIIIITKTFNIRLAFINKFWSIMIQKLTLINWLSSKNFLSERLEKQQNSAVTFHQRNTTAKIDKKLIKQFLTINRLINH